MESLSEITGALWYMRTRDTERDLHVLKSGDTIQKIAKKYNERLESHPKRLTFAAQSFVKSKKKKKNQKTGKHIFWNALYILFKMGIIGLNFDFVWLKSFEAAY